MPSNDELKKEQNKIHDLVLLNLERVESLEAAIETIKKRDMDFQSLIAKEIKELKVIVHNQREVHIDGHTKDIMKIESSLDEIEKKYKTLNNLAFNCQKGIARNLEKKVELGYCMDEMEQIDLIKAVLSKVEAFLRNLVYKYINKDGDKYGIEIEFLFKELDNTFKILKQLGGEKIDHFKEWQKGITVFNMDEFDIPEHQTASGNNEIKKKANEHLENELRLAKKKDIVNYMYDIYDTKSIEPTTDKEQSLWCCDDCELTKPTKQDCIDCKKVSKTNHHKAPPAEDNLLDTTEGKKHKIINHRAKSAEDIIYYKCTRFSISNKMDCSYQTLKGCTSPNHIQDCSWKEELDKPAERIYKCNPSDLSTCVFGLCSYYPCNEYGKNLSKDKPAEADVNSVEFMGILPMPKEPAESEDMKNGFSSWVKFFEVENKIDVLVSKEQKRKLIPIIRLIVDDANKQLIEEITQKLKALLDYFCETEDEDIERNMIEDLYDKYKERLK